MTTETKRHRMTINSYLQEQLQITLLYAILLYLVNSSIILPYDIMNCNFVQRIATRYQIVSLFAFFHHFLL